MESLADCALERTGNLQYSTHLMSRTSGHYCQGRACVHGRRDNCAVSGPSNVCSVLTTYVQTYTKKKKQTFVFFLPACCAPRCAYQIITGATAETHPKCPASKHSKLLCSPPRANTRTEPGLVQVRPGRGAEAHAKPPPNCLIGRISSLTILNNGLQESRCTRRVMRVRRRE